MNHSWTAASAVEIGIDWLEREIAPAGDFGRRAREAERPFVPGDETRARVTIAHVHATACELAPRTLTALREAIAACPDPGAALGRALAGGILSDADFFEISRFLDAALAVRGIAEHSLLAAVALPPWPESLASALAPGRTRERTFYLADAFDAELASARGDAAAQRARYDAERRRLTARVATYAGADDIRDGEFVLMRDRAPAPLPSEIRVLREAATYYLCEIALDTAARGALENLEVAEARVAEREDAVRVRLSRAVADAGDSLQTAMNALGTLDAFVSRALFAQRYETCVPEISVAPAVSFSDARLLPLEELLSARGHRYAPLSLSLEGVGVLTGPNMGGKTAALRTVGFVAACIVLGLPVPAASARVALFDEMAWIGMGAEGEGASLLSSFGREVAQLRDFLARKPGRPLVLVDEFARTTSPREGRALLVALVERLRDGDAVGLVATHLSGIAEDAHAPHYAVVGLRESPKRSDGAIDLDAAIDRIADVMDYRVRRVTADEEVRADAIALADVLGLDASLIVRARSAL